MGRRDSDGSKKKSWMIEAGDWEKLYNAFIKAKEKNNLLDLRLERALTGIEKEKIHRDGVLFNDIYEQKQLVFKYKCEVKEMKREALKRDREHSTKTPGNDYAPANTGRNEAKLGYPRNTVTNNGDRKLTYYGSMTSRSDTFVTQNNKLNLPVIKNDVPNKTNSKTPKETPQTNNAVEIKERDNHPNKEQENPVKFPALNHPEVQDETAPGNLNNGEKDSNQPKKLDIVTAEYWVGDPIAIRSVRRPRLQPNEMSDHCQPYGEARKLMVNMPKYPSCSRNCNKPGAELETMVADVSMLPKMRMPSLSRELKGLSQSQEHLPDILPGSRASQAVMELLEQHQKIDSSLKPILETAKCQTQDGTTVTDITEPFESTNDDVVGDFSHDIEKAIPRSDTSELVPQSDTEKAVPEGDTDSAYVSTYNEPTSVSIDMELLENATESLENVEVLNTAQAEQSIGGAKSASKTTPTSRPSGTRSKRYRKAPAKSRAMAAHLHSHNSPTSSATVSVEGLVKANKNVPVNAPIDVLARVQQGDMRVKSLTDTTRKVAQIVDEAERRSITSRRDSTYVDSKTKFKANKVRNVIRFAPTKATRSMAAPEVAS